MADGKRVDVIGIGVQRSGTTWVFEALKQHPEITTPDGPDNKETNFFNFNYQKGYDWYHNRYSTRESPILDYSVLYWSHPAVPGRIHRYNPEAKLILALRDPIERAFSQHKLQVRRGRVSGDDRRFERALEQNPTYVEQGYYASHFKQYLDYFNRKSIKIILFEEIVNNPEKTVRDLYEFIGINADVRPDHLDQKINRSKLFRLEFLKEFRFGFSNFLRSNLGEWSIDLLKSTHVPELFKKLNERSTDETIDPPDEATIRQLREEFTPEISELEDLTGLDLAHWLSPSFPRTD